MNQRIGILAYYREIIGILMFECRPHLPVELAEVIAQIVVAPLIQWNQHTISHCCALSERVLELDRDSYFTLKK